jgi:ubiquinone/menaquinone biosynthesis C-methylase UbiE
VAIPAIGMEEKLSAGAKVADVGCGSGIALIELASAFPKSQFVGYEISERALDRAEVNRTAAGPDNLAFHNAAKHPMPGDGSFDLVLTFDCLHDMTRPDRIMEQIREGIADDGVWLIADIKARETYEENVAKNPMAAMMYGVSILHCMSSSLSEPDGMGLGTLGFHEGLAKDLAVKAGFGHFSRVKINHPINAFYTVRP